MLRYNKNALNLTNVANNANNNANVYLDQNLKSAPTPQPPSLKPSKFHDLLGGDQGVGENAGPPYRLSRIPRLKMEPLLKKPSAGKLLQQQKLDSKDEPLAKKSVEIKKKQPVEPPKIEDIDKPTGRDAVFQVCEVAADIYDYMFDLELKQSIDKDYLKDQKILTPKVRQRLVNWCIDIQSTLKLLPETLYMTIAVMDRYFNRITVKQQQQVQLVAVGATLIASKYEEIYPPDVGDLLYLTQNAYNKADIMRIEIEMLDTLNYNLGRPIPPAFLRRFSRAAHSDLKIHSIAKFLMELSLCEYETCHWPPSMLAAAALFVSINITDRNGNNTSSSTTSPQDDGYLTRRVASRQLMTTQARMEERWTPTLAHYTRYTCEQLCEPAGVLCKIWKRAQRNPTSFTSYKKHSKDLVNWPELKSSKLDELMKQVAA